MECPQETDFHVCHDLPCPKRARLAAVPVSLLRLLRGEDLNYGPCTFGFISLPADRSLRELISTVVGCEARANACVALGHVSFSAGWCVAAFLLLRNGRVTVLRGRNKNRRITFHRRVLVTPLRVAPFEIFFLRNSTDGLSHIDIWLTTISRIYFIRSP